MVSGAIIVIIIINITYIWHTFQNLYLLFALKIPSIVCSRVLVVMSWQASDKLFKAVP